MPEDEEKIYAAPLLQGALIMMVMTYREREGSKPSEEPQVIRAAMNALARSVGQELDVDASFTLLGT